MRPFSGARPASSITLDGSRSRSQLLRIVYDLLARQVLRPAACTQTSCSCLMMIARRRERNNTGLAHRRKSYPSRHRRPAFLTRQKNPDA
jgi:hypothetical protein